MRFKKSGNGSRTMNTKSPDIPHTDHNKIWTHRPTDENMKHRVSFPGWNMVMFFCEKILTPTQKAAYDSILNQKRKERKSTCKLLNRSKVFLGNVCMNFTEGLHYTIVKLKITRCFIFSSKPRASYNFVRSFFLRVTLLNFLFFVIRHCVNLHCFWILP